MPSQTTKEKNLKLHIWRRTLGPLLLKYAPKTQDLGAQLWLPPWVAFRVTEPSTHRRGQLPATVQGSPKWAFSPDLTALLLYLPQPWLQWLLCVPSSPQGHCGHKREKTVGTPSCFLRRMTRSQSRCWRCLQDLLWVNHHHQPRRLFLKIK